MTCSPFSFLSFFTFSIFSLAFILLNAFFFFVRIFRFCVLSPCFMCRGPHSGVGIGCKGSDVSWRDSGPGPPDLVSDALRYQALSCALTKSAWKRSCRASDTGSGGLGFGSRCDTSGFCNQY